MDLEKLSEQFNRRHPEPGTAPIPQGHVRLFHYTDNLPAIRREGIRLGAARGETYGEPNQVWAAAGIPRRGMLDYKDFVEFSADPNDLDIGRGSAPEDLEARGSHVTLPRDVPKSQVVATHEPWHKSARYLMEYDDDYVASLLDDDWRGETGTAKALEFHRRVRRLPPSKRKWTTNE